MFAMLQDLARDKKKLALTGAVFVVALYLDFSMVIGGQIKGLNATRQKIVSLRKEISQLNSDIEYVKKTTRSEAAPVAVKKLPTEKEIPSLMQTISAIANENGIRIMQIDSVKDSGKAGKKGSAQKSKKGAKASTTAEAAVLSQVNIKLELIASYHKLGMFINGIENAEKLCIIDDITINRDAADPLKQNVSLVVKTYVKK